MKRILSIALLMSLLLGLMACSDTKELTPKLSMHVIDVGQGESILLQAGEKVVLVDAGDRSKGGVVVDYLKKRGIESIDLFITSHPHADHIGGAVEVLKNFEVKRIIDSGKVHTSQTYLDYLRMVDEKRIPFEVADYQQVILSQEVELQVIGPVRDYTSLNDSSVVTKVTVGSISVLLTGDMEQAAERDLMTKADVGATILKVGHHGSKTSTSPDFLAAVSPKVAVISVGEGNTYGHPTEEVLGRLSSRDAGVYRTDRHGHVVITTDGKSFTVRTERKGN